MCLLNMPSYIQLQRGCGGVGVVRALEDRTALVWILMLAAT
jgi:hypothetical protein